MSDDHSSSTQIDVIGCVVMIHIALSAACHIESGSRGLVRSGDNSALKAAGGAVRFVCLRSKSQSIREKYSLLEEIYYESCNLVSAEEAGAADT